MLTHLRFKPATIVVTSELPLGSGLGSSVALCVAFSAALFACSDCECGHETRVVNFWGVQGFQINQIILTKLYFWVGSRQEKERKICYLFTFYILYIRVV
jgi:hypothetical protein